MVQTMRSALLRFYDARARDLPWRRTRDPYAIWVSEVMLQQTQVETVLGYYDRFLARFPSPAQLAAAAEDEVMAAWSGLGYYRRARLLHAGVREVVAHYGGQVPEDAAARRALPGVGRYTAGAIGSIAFDREEPIVDGNVARVLCRVHAIDGAPERAPVQQLLWSHAAALVEGPRPGDLNQALMELGATLCKKAQPACGECPIQSHCQAYARGLQAVLPRARAHKAPLARELVALLATGGSARRPTLLLARAQTGLFGGLWNLPMAEGRGRRTAQALLADVAVAGTLAPRALDVFTHVLTHRKLSVQLWRVTGARARAPAKATVQSQLQPLSTLSELGVSRLTTRALETAGLQGAAPRARTKPGP